MLAGVALAAVMSSLITLLVVRDEAVYAHLRFWSMGQLIGRAAVLDDIVAFAVAGLLLALPFGRTLNVLSMGEEAARGLGVRVERAQLLGAAVAVLLCAAGTAAVGPVAFVGLVAAHCARMLAGADHRWSLPLSMACGAILPGSSASCRSPRSTRSPSPSAIWSGAAGIRTAGSVSGAPRRTTS
nr:iron chelate uptake ABC transporter family permease subunit [Streptomyces sp. CB02130]